MDIDRFSTDDVSIMKQLRMLPWCI